MRAISIRFRCDPDRVDQLIAAALGEVRAIQQQLQRSRETELRNNAAWAGWLTYAYYYKDDPAAVVDTARILERVTSKRVQAAAKHFLDLKADDQIVVVPESK
jgi:predicted Zn-dependent peptidase